MQHHKLFSTIIMISALMNCSAMDKKPYTSLEPIILNDGLLTAIQPTYVHFHSKKWYKRGPAGFYAQTIEIGETQRLINLIETQNVVGYENGSFTDHHQFFCPTIIKIETNGTLDDLGSFNIKKHREATEACRMKKPALFYPYEQGAIVYTLNSSKFLKFNKKELESHIDSNREKRHFW